MSERILLLPEALRLRMERIACVGLPRLIPVRLGDEAAGLGVRALAGGGGIWISPEHFGPGARCGLALLGHELAHLAQRHAGCLPETAAGGGVRVLDDPALEQEADWLGIAFASEGPTD